MALDFRQPGCLRDGCDCGEYAPRDNPDDCLPSSTACACGHAPSEHGITSSAPPQVTHES